MENNENNIQQPTRRSDFERGDKISWIHKNWWILVLAFIGLALLFSNNQCSSGVYNLSFQDKTMSQVKTDLQTASEEALEMDRTVKGFIDANQQLVDNNTCSKDEYYYNKRVSGPDSESSSPENINENLNIIYVDRAGEASSSEDQREKILKEHEISPSKSSTSTTNNYNTKNYYYNSRAARKSTSQKVVYRDREEVIYVPATTSTPKTEVKDCKCGTTSLPCFNASAKQKGLKWSSSDPATAKVLNSDGTYYTGTENPFEGGYEKQK